MTLRTFLLGASCILLAGCNASDGQITDTGEIQRQARITIPASATNIHCGTDAVHRGPNAATYGRFDIPKGDLALVMAGMPGEQKTKPYDGHSNVTSHQMRQTWWQPESLSQKQVADWSMPGFSVNLLVGQNENKDTVTVYFFNFSM
jgi:hypothetical protein